MLGKLNARRRRRSPVFSRAVGREGALELRAGIHSVSPPTLQAELSAPSSPFLPSSFEEPETSPVEESWEHPEPPSPGDKLVVGSAGSRGHGEWAQEEQQLYQRLLVEPEYISNPGTSALSPDTAPEAEPGPISVFPSAFLSPALGCQGNLTLDRVKINCGSFPR